MPPAVHRLTKTRRRPVATVRAILVVFLPVLVLSSPPGRGLLGAEPAYNGIVDPPVWPPRQETLSREPLSTPPYLVSPPAVIPVDVGRQLFVDDFLIEATTLERKFHQAEYHADNPLLGPDKPWEGKGGRARAAPFSDGVWFDPADQLFKMWYWAAANSEKPLSFDTCLATSRDGLRWEKPEFEVVPGTNVVLRDEAGVNRNSSTVWLDHFEKDPAKRFKMFRVVKRSNFNRVRLSTSPDGIHWTAAGETDDVGDRTTVFYNPFRERWIYSLRTGTTEMGRCRAYAESVDPVPRGRWVTNANYGRGKTFWVGADRLDPDRPELNLRREASRPADLVPSQLYNLDGVAYESLMLGLFSIWRGQPTDRPKINEVCVGFSRDGFHWSRPEDRRPLCGVSEDRNAWNWGNVQSTGGCCLIVGDKLHFYVGGVSGRQPVWHPDPSFCGLATLRRDGFASMHAGAGGGRRRVDGRSDRRRGTGDRAVHPRQLPAGFGRQNAGRSKMEGLRRSGLARRQAGANPVPPAERRIVCVLDQPRRERRERRLRGGGGTRIYGSPRRAAIKNPSRTGRSLRTVNEAAVEAHHTDNVPRRRRARRLVRRGRVSLLEQSAAA